MRAEDPRARWGAGSGANRAWVFAVADAACRILPRPVRYAAADSLAEWYGGRSPTTLAALESNLRGAFPDRPAAWAEAMALATLRRYLRGVADYLAGLPDPPVVEEGPGARETLEACPGGKVMLCAHLGNWEVGGFFLGNRLGRHHVVSFPEADAGVGDFREARRADAGLVTHTARAGLHNLFTLRSVLEGGESVVVLVDRAAGRDGVEVVFRGRRTRFLRSPAVMASLADVWAVPTAVVALGPGRYSALVGPPCRRRGEAAGPAEVMQRAAAWFSDVLERHPDQWYNFFPFWQEEP